MKAKKKEIDILNTPLTKGILLFTLPIALSSIVQQLFNAADTAVVGHFTNSNALAAVGTNTEIIALTVTISVGLALGANILIAQLIGENKKDKIPAAVQSAILLALIIGVFGLAVGQLLASPILKMIKTPSVIFSSAEAYLRIYILGYPFLLLYDFGSAILRAKGDSRRPFRILVLCGIINAVLNIIFVTVFHMGVSGVALATDISNATSAVIILHRLKKDELFAFTFKEIRLSKNYVKSILSAGVPSAISGAVFCFANIFVQASVNTFGKTAIAGSTIATNFEYFTYYIITAFAQTTTTFISQNHAAGKTKRCKKIFALSMLWSTVCSTLFIFLIVVFRSSLSGLFSSEAEVIEYACLRIMCILLYEPICNFFEIPSGYLRGSGHPLYPAVATIIGTCVFRIVWIFTFFKMSPTLPHLYMAFPLSYVTDIVLVNLGFLIIKIKNNKPQKSKSPR